MGLSFTIAAVPLQRSHSRVRVPRDSRPYKYFTVSDLRLPEPGGPSARIYIPQEQGGPIIPPGTGLPFRRLPRLAGRRWRYSNLPAHGVFKHEVHRNNIYKFSSYLTENTVVSLQRTLRRNNFLPHVRYTASLTRTSRIMLFREIITFYFRESYQKIISLWGEMHIFRIIAVGFI
jgi:hypothetical protein